MWKKRDCEEDSGSDDGGVSAAGRKLVPFDEKGNPSFPSFIIADLQALLEESNDAVDEDDGAGAGGLIGVNVSTSSSLLNFPSCSHSHCAILKISSLQ